MVEFGSHLFGGNLVESGRVERVLPRQPRIAHRRLHSALNHRADHAIGLALGHVLASTRNEQQAAQPRRQAQE